MLSDCAVLVLTPTFSFGGASCIIVRNETAKADLQAKLSGSNSFKLILTVLEAKGLEFDQVLLYRFFSDCATMSNDWRLLQSQHSSSTISCSAPTFDPLRHAGLLPDLKALYVSITRARNRLWIVDEGEPLRHIRVSVISNIHCDASNTSSSSGVLAL